MSPLRIAPYLAQNIQQSYLRQQRVGERIAGDKVKPTRKHDPAAEVAISTKAQEAAELGRANQPPAVQIDQLAEEFVRRFFEPEGPAQQADGSEGEAVNTPGGRTAFVRLLESYGFTIQQDEHGADEAVVSQETGDTLVRLTAETKENAKKEILTLTRGILSSML